VHFLFAFPRYSCIRRVLLWELRIAIGYQLMYTDIMGKIRMNIYLTGKQKASMEKLSAKTGAPVAERVRRAVDNYLTMRKKELK
jgi:hypothetical protein